MWLVAINPIAGGGRGSRIGDEVTAYLSRKGERYKVCAAPTAELFSTQLETHLRSEKCSGVIAVGGDGLAHLVLQVAVPQRIPFAIIPAGTGNDFVRSCGWSVSDIRTQLDAITSTQPTPIDLGNVDSEWFGAILSTGFDSVVNERANRLKWPKGPQRYNAAIALELPRFKPKSFRIEIDSNSIETEAMLIAIGNGRSYGGGMYICPQAKMDDGLFDVVILEPVSKFEFLKVFPTVYSGSHINHPRVKVLRGKRVSLTADAVAYADGERIGAAPIKAECISNAGLTWTL